MLFKCLLLRMQKYSKRVKAVDLQNFVDSRWVVAMNSGRVARVLSNVAKVQWDIAKVRRDIAKVRRDVAKVRVDIAKARVDIVKARWDVANVRRGMLQPSGGSVFTPF